MHVSFVVNNLFAALAIVAFTLWVFAAATFFSFLAALLMTLTRFLLAALVLSLAAILVALWTIWILSALLLIFVTIPVIVIIHNIPFFKKQINSTDSISYLEERWVEFAL